MRDEIVDAVARLVVRLVGLAVVVGWTLVVAGWFLPRLGTLVLAVVVTPGGFLVAVFVWRALGRPRRIKY